MSVSGSPTSPSNTFDAGGTTPTDINTGLTVGCGTLAEGFPVLSGLSSVPGSGAVTSSSALSSLGGANIPIADPSGAGLEADWGAGAKSFDYRLSGARRDRQRDRARTEIGQPDRREHPDAGLVVAVWVLKRAAAGTPRAPQ
jgi:hypothetical protein